MTRARRSQWPAELGPATPQDKARTIARGYRALAAKWATALAGFRLEEMGAPTAAQAIRDFKTELDQLDALTTRVGEADWLMPAMDIRAELGERLTRVQVARLGAVSPATVTTWCDRGVAGVRLTRGADGLYDPDEVAALLAHRDRSKAGTAEHTPGRHDEEPEPCPNPTSGT